MFLLWFQTSHHMNNGIVVILIRFVDSRLMILSCEDNLDPQLDPGNEEVIRVALLTFDLKR